MEMGKEMLANRWIVLAAALIFWAVYFHTIDRVVMNGQGLPVGIVVEGRALPQPDP